MVFENNVYMDGNVLSVLRHICPEYMLSSEDEGVGRKGEKLAHPDRQRCFYLIQDKNSKQGIFLLPVLNTTASLERPPTTSYHFFFDLYSTEMEIIVKSLTPQTLAGS